MTITEETLSLSVSLTAPPFALPVGKLVGPLLSGAFQLLLRQAFFQNNWSALQPAANTGNDSKGSNPPPRHKMRMINVLDTFQCRGVIKPANVDNRNITNITTFVVCCHHQFP